MPSATPGRNLSTLNSTEEKDLKAGHARRQKAEGIGLESKGLLDTSPPS